jgi:hypothetical protein
MRVPERPEISSATLAFAGNGEIRAGIGARRKDGFWESYTEGTEEDAQREISQVLLALMPSGVVAGRFPAANRWVSFFRPPACFVGRNWSGVELGVLKHDKYSAVGERNRRITEMVAPTERAWLECRNDSSPRRLR